MDLTKIIAITAFVLLISGAGTISYGYDGWNYPKPDYNFEEELERIIDEWERYPHMAEADAEIVYESGRDRTDTYVIICNSALYDGIDDALDDYVDQLEDEGYSVDVITWTHGPGGVTSPEVLRDYLIDNYYDDGTPYFHLLFIGDLPIAYFYKYDIGIHIFPFDVFYSELDGEWTEYEDEEYWPVYDGHSGGDNIYPDIPVGRWYVSTLTYGNYSQEDLVEAYIEKNLAYRQGDMEDPPPVRALNYYDEAANPDNAWLVEESLEDSYGTGNVTTVDDPWTTWDTNYEYMIDEQTKPEQGYEWVALNAHGNPTNNSFERPIGGPSYTYYYEILGIEPQVLFYGNHGCDTHRYIEENYIGGWYVFVPTCEWGLASIGHTDSVPLGIENNFNTIVWPDLHAALGNGDTLGEGLRLEISGVDYTTTYEWSPMARILVGDTTLKISEFMGARYATNGEGEESHGVRSAVTLYAPRPNPATRYVTFGYELGPDEAGTVTIYDVSGRRVRELAVEGEGEVTWDMRSDSGVPVAPGVYLLRLERGSASATRKLVILK